MVHHETTAIVAALLQTEMEKSPEHRKKIVEKIDFYRELLLSNNFMTIEDVKRKAEEE